MKLSILLRFIPRRLVLGLAATGMLFTSCFSCSSAMRFHSRPVAGSSRQCIWPARVYCDVDLGTPMCDKLREATMVWNDYATHMGVRPFFEYRGMFKFDEDNADAIVDPAVVYATMPATYEFVHDGDQAIAVTKQMTMEQTQCRYAAEIEWKLNPAQMSPGSISHVWLHELGHTLGLPDMGVHGCLMYGGSGLNLPPFEAPVLCESEENLLRAMYGNLW